MRSPNTKPRPVVARGNFIAEDAEERRGGASVLPLPVGEGRGEGFLVRVYALCIASSLAFSGCGKTPEDAPPTVAPLSAAERAARHERAFASLHQQAAAVRAGTATKIEIDDGELRDDDLAELDGLKGLEVLVLRKTDLSDAATKHLAVHEKLTRLLLGKTQFTDAGLSQLAKLTMLRDLNLEACDATDAGLARVAKLPYLESLRFGQSQITSAGLANLKDAKNLKVLILQHAHITDAGLKHLTGLTELETLYLEGNEVSEEGKDEFRKAIAPRYVHIH